MSEKRAKKKAGDAVPAGVKVGMYGRRTWDKEHFANKAAEMGISNEDIVARKLFNSGSDIKILPASKRMPLQARKEDVLASIAKDVVGKRQKVEDDDDEEDKSLPGSRKQGAFACEKCNVSFKDSGSYLDHLNSRGHVAAMGMTMQAERATVDSVRAKLMAPKSAVQKRKVVALSLEEEKPAKRSAIGDETSLQEPEDPVQQQDQSLNAEQQCKEATEEDHSAQMIKMMGFAAFGTRKN